MSYHFRDSNSNTQIKISILRWKPPHFASVKGRISMTSLYLNFSLCVLGVAGAADHAAPPVPVGHPAQLQLRLHVRAGLGARQGGRCRGRPGPRGGPRAAVFSSRNLLGLGTSAMISGRVSGRVARGVLADDEEALPHELLAHLGRHGGGRDGAISLLAKSPVEIALMRYTQYGL